MANGYNQGGGMNGGMNGNSNGNGNIDITPMPEQETPSDQPMRVYGTGELYSGLTVLIGGYHYTTVGGALEGNSLQLVPLPARKAPLPNEPIDDITETTNPVIRLFQAPATPRYRRSDNNLVVPIGANLHEHADGTIMTEHSMGPNDNSVIVFEILDDEVGDITEDTNTNQQNQQGGGGGGMNEGTQGDIVIDDPVIDPQAGQGGGGLGGGQN
jgi:hypothetical protein